LNIEKLQDLVRDNDKQRYDLILEGADGQILENVCGITDIPEKSAILQSQALKKKGIWLIRARQGHSMKVRQSRVQSWTHRILFIEYPAGDEADSFTQ
jgi:hypothetical protein